MAKTKINTEPIEQPIVDEPTAEPVKSVYTVNDLAKGAYMLGSTPDLVVAAFRYANKSEATWEEAIDIIHDFAAKEVV